MSTDTCQIPPVALGFLTVVNQTPHGLIGGYLVVDAGARPLEFHCTEPVRANRAQEILYGATLEPYLYGEQIGSTLIRAAQTKTCAVFTDCSQALAAAQHVAQPLWLVLSATEDAAAEAAAPANAALSGGSAAAMPSEARSLAGQDLPFAQGSSIARRLDTAESLAAPRGLTISQLGRNRVARAPAGSAGLSLGGKPLVNEIDEYLAAVAAGIDLSEPFERIRAAIDEAQRGAR